VRFQIGDDIYSVADDVTRDIGEEDKVYIVIDRLVRKEEDTFNVRLTDSLRIALEK
jgi:excinuclease UvrABC ATPase subunit